MALNSERSVAIEAVRAASRVCQAVQRRLVRPETLEKKDKSPVTVADFASQAVVCGRLATAFAADPMVAEEDSAELREESHAAIRRIVVEQVSAVAGRTLDDKTVLDWIDHGRTSGGVPRRFWTLDPIDGTKGFLRAEQYAVALALIEGGRVVLGVLGCPNLPVNGGSGAILVAVRGEGSRILPMDGTDDRGTPIHVSPVTDTKLARFCESVESGHSDQGRSVKIAQLLGITAPGVRMDSQAKYAAVARGDAQIYLRLPTKADYQEKIWDHAAGMLVTEEAGGRVTDIHGQPLDFGRGPTLSANKGVVATNRHIHDAVIEAIRKA